MVHNFENSINYFFNNRALLKTALTHSSFANEKKDKSIISNERLEFLGDAVLSFIVSDYIYKNYKNLPEGELTRIRASVVCEQSLSLISKSLGVGDYISLGKGEEQTGGKERSSILSDAFEAILAAIYLDGGIEKAKEFALSHLEDSIKKAKKGKLFTDYKTKLQEIIQRKQGEVIEYVLALEKGPDHNKSFFVEVLKNNVVIGKGFGKTKKEAEQNAAKSAINALGE